MGRLKSQRLPGKLEDIFFVALENPSEKKKSPLQNIVAHSWHKMEIYGVDLDKLLLRDHIHFFHDICHHLKISQ